MSNTESENLWSRTVKERDVVLGKSSLQESALKVARAYRDENPGDSGYTYPRYLVVLDGNSRDLVTVAGFMTPKDEIEGDPEGVYGDVRWDDGLISEWTEPAVGLLLAEHRDHRWALVSELKNEHVSPEDIEVLRIAGDMAQTELLCSHPDTIVFDLRDDCVVYD